MLAALATPGRDGVAVDGLVAVIVSEVRPMMPGELNIDKNPRAIGSILAPAHRRGTAQTAGKPVGGPDTSSRPRGGREHLAAGVVFARR